MIVIVDGNTQLMPVVGSFSGIMVALPVSVDSVDGLRIGGGGDVEGLVMFDSMRSL